MFGETTIFYIKTWNHSTETSIYKKLFRVPGMVNVGRYNRPMHPPTAGTAESTSEAAPDTLPALPALPEAVETPQKVGGVGIVGYIQAIATRTVPLNGPRN